MPSIWEYPTITWLGDRGFFVEASSPAATVREQLQEYPRDWLVLIDPMSPGNFYGFRAAAVKRALRGMQNSAVRRPISDFVGSVTRHQIETIYYEPLGPQQQQQQQHKQQRQVASRLVVLLDRSGKPVRLGSYVGQQQKQQQQQQQQQQQEQQEQQHPMEAAPPVSGSGEFVFGRFNRLGLGLGLSLDGGLFAQRPSPAAATMVGPTKAKPDAASAKAARAAKAASPKAGAAPAKLARTAKAMSPKASAASAKAARAAKAASPKAGAAPAKLARAAKAASPKAGAAPAKPARTAKATSPKASAASAKPARAAKAASPVTRSANSAGAEKAASLQTAPLARNKLEQSERQPVPLTVSGNAPQELQIRDTGRLKFRIEHAAEATPLSGAHADALVEPDEPIRVSLAANGVRIELVGADFRELTPPQPGDAAESTFAIKPMETGDLDLALLFRQGGSELARLIFKVKVIEGVASKAAIGARKAAAPRELAADDLVDLYIEERQELNGVRYRYLLTATSHDIRYREFSTPNVLKDRGGGIFASTIAYVDWIYKQVGKELEGRADAADLQRSVRAIGVDLCKQLFDADFIRTLWPLRDRIRMIRIVSWEPFIPWELLRLRNPDTGEDDEKYLAEYGLVRELITQDVVRRLSLDRWKYLKGEYLSPEVKKIGAEIDYFTRILPGRGVHPTAIEPDDDAFYECVKKGDFDVLHIACHGNAEHTQIESSELLIGEADRGPGQPPKPIVIDPVTLRSEGNMRKSKPIVFLNACESGRLGPSLTSWSGWPEAFLSAGAGVFVGTSWPIRDQPSRVFAETFYDALLAGNILAEATTMARAKAKELGDASWLAYKVFGYPLARHVSGLPI